jgi:hypothetical protein
MKRCDLVGKLGNRFGQAMGVHPVGQLVDTGLKCLELRPKWCVQWCDIAVV